MSREKTEKPTSKKLRDERKKGHVAWSSEASAALIFLAAAISLAATIPGSLRSWNDLVRKIWTPAHFQARMNPIELTRHSLQTLLEISTPVLATAVLAGILAGIAMIGPLFVSVRCDTSRINPVANARKLFALQKLTDLLRNQLKLIVFTAVTLGVSLHRLKILLTAGDVSTRSWLGFCSSWLVRIQFAVLLTVIVFGIADLLIQRFRWLKNMRMTREEVIREHKEEEGDPLAKSMRRSLHQQLSMMDLPGRVAGARVVIVNPTRYAVAVSYDDHWECAPKIAAKGYMDLAAHIRSLATANAIPILRHPPLARRLFELQLDQEIPPELFRAVAELLIYLQNLTPSERSRCL